MSDSVDSRQVALQVCLVCFRSNGRRPAPMSRCLFLLESLTFSVNRYCFWTPRKMTSDCCLVTPVKERNDFDFFDNCLCVSMKWSGLHLALDLIVKEYV